MGVADNKTRGLHNGGQWADNASNNDLSWSTTPKVGTAAVKPGNPGHVAYVEAVNSNGTITVTEYNHDTHGNGDTRTGTPSSMGFTKFVDFGVSTNNGGGSGGAANPQGNGVQSATFLGSDHLDNGQVMQSNQYILSSNGKYVFTMQTDGNLVLYGPGYQALWGSGTDGHPGSYLGLQSDGNMVIYSSTGSPLWASNTGGSNLATMKVQNDGNVVSYTSTGAGLWATDTATPSQDNAIFEGDDRLTNGQTLHQREYIQSPDKRYVLIMQSDGNLVLYGPGYHPLWGSGTNGHPDAYLGLQSDGNMVIYSSTGSPLWASNTGGKNLDRLQVQDDGNVVAYTPSETGLWDTNTRGRI